ncbi:MAG: magnesium transporter [Pseudomonadota bacterium]
MTEEDAAIADDLTEVVRNALAADDPAAVRTLVAEQHPADIAELFRFLDDGDRRGLLAALGDGLDPEVLSYVDEELRPDLTAFLGAERTAALLAELETDDAIAFLEELDDALQLGVLAALPSAERKDVQQSLAYDEYTAGRLMQRAFVALPDYWAVGQAIDFLRTQPELPDDFYDIYLVNPRFEPVGSIPLSMILRSVRSTPLRELKIRELRLIEAAADQEDVARTFRKYGLVSAPVIGTSRRIIGVITVDDIVDVIDEEAEEDLMKLSGVSEIDVLRPFAQTVRKRQPWLIANMGTAILAAAVIAQFEASIEAIVALAVLMPIVASMGGNSGSQTLTVVVRGLATGEVTSANAWRVFRKELAVGLANGATFFVVGGLVALAGFGFPALALVFGLALLVTLFFAAAVGVLIPLTLQRLNVDPAVASAVFVTTITDVFGFATFLGAATLVLL